ncbi:hypothetical protein ACFL4T_06245 [candidate division KSB1 bacterium]
MNIDSFKFHLGSKFILEAIKVNDKQVSWKKSTSGNEVFYICPLSLEKKPAEISIKYSGLIDNEFIVISPDVKWFPEPVGHKVDNYKISITPASFELSSSISRSISDAPENDYFFEVPSALNDFAVVLFKNFQAKKIRYNDNTVLTVYSKSVEKSHINEMRTAVESLLGIFMENFGSNYSSKTIKIFMSSDVSGNKILSGVHGIFSPKVLNNDSGRITDNKDFFKKLSYSYSDNWLKNTPEIEKEGFRNYFAQIFLERLYGVVESDKVSQQYKNLLTEAENGMPYKIPLLLKNISHLIGYEKFKKVLKNITINNGYISTASIIEKIDELYGRNLKWYVQQFMESNDLPEIEINYSVIQDENSYKVNFSVFQHSENVFKVPVDIEIIFENDSEYRIVLIDKKEMNFNLEFDIKPENIIIDPYKLFLGKMDVKVN